MKVELELKEWQTIAAILAEAPWKLSNPILMKIDSQLKEQNDARSE